MIQSLFLPNDCNDGSGRLQSGVDRLSGAGEGDVFMLFFF